MNINYDLLNNSFHLPDNGMLEVRLIFNQRGEHPNYYWVRKFYSYCSIKGFNFITFKTKTDAQLNGANLYLTEDPLILFQRELRDLTLAELLENIV